MHSYNNNPRALTLYSYAISVVLLALTVTPKACTPQCIDNDADGFGANCQAGPDCDDTNELVNPQADEQQDGADQDCDGIIDEGVTVSVDTALDLARGTGGTIDYLLPVFDAQERQCFNLESSGYVGYDVARCGERGALYVTFKNFPPGSDSLYLVLGDSIVPCTTCDLVAYNSETLEATFRVNAFASPIAIAQDAQGRAEAVAARGLLPEPENFPPCRNELPCDPGFIQDQGETCMTAAGSYGRHQICRPCAEVNTCFAAYCNGLWEENTCICLPPNLPCNNDQHKLAKDEDGICRCKHCSERYPDSKCEKWKTGHNNVCFCEDGHCPSHIINAEICAAQNKAFDRIMCQCECTAGTIGPCAPGETPDLTSCECKTCDQLKPGTSWCQATKECCPTGQCTSCGCCDGFCIEGQCVPCMPETGEACSVGVGACQAEGTVQCDGSCNAQAGTPATEVCDDVDNDCDGQADEDGVCVGCTPGTPGCDDSCLDSSFPECGDSGLCCPAGDCINGTCSRACGSEPPNGNPCKYTESTTCCWNPGTCGYDNCECSWPETSCPGADPTSGAGCCPFNHSCNAETNQCQINCFGGTLCAQGKQCCRAPEYCAGSDSCVSPCDPTGSQKRVCEQLNADSNQVFKYKWDPNTCTCAADSCRYAACPSFPTCCPASLQCKTAPDGSQGCGTIVDCATSHSVPWSTCVGNSGAMPCTDSTNCEEKGTCGQCPLQAECCRCAGNTCQTGEWWIH